MKFQPDSATGVNSIARQEPGRVFVSTATGTEPYSSPIVVPWVGAVQQWPVAGFDALQASHFEQLLALQPELVIFGSGERIRFVHPALLAALMNAGIGVETMDTPAACRTYNVLVSESRSVVAALLINAPSA
jgi:uncharacterized protein